LSAEETSVSRVIFHAGGYLSQAMSRRLDTVRTRVESPIPKGEEVRADIDTVHTVETAELTASETVCESPICNVSFPPSGLEIEPRRFCSGDCRQHASLIRRVRKLLENETDERALAILRGKP
jgi:hypothetical protein